MNRKIYLAGLAILAIGCSQPLQETAWEKGNTNKRTDSAGVEPDGPAIVQRPRDPNRQSAIDLTNSNQSVAGLTEPSIIDTRIFQPQIQNAEPWQGETITPSSLLPKKSPQPPLAVGPPNNISAGQLRNAERVFEGSFFPGILMSPWNPPDPSIGVGPNHIIETVNMELAFFQKNGVQTFQQRLDSSGNPGFFEEIGGGDFCFDPKCFYDHYANRYLVLALEHYGSADESWVTIAVSDDDDPNGIWYKYRTFSIVEVGSSEYWVDYPGLGYDQNGYYITGNLFLESGTGDGTAGVFYRVFDKTPLLSGSTATFNDLRDGSAFTAQAAQHFGNNPVPYFVSRSNSTQLRVAALNDPFGDPELIATTVNVPSAPSPPGEVPNAGGNISTVGNRLMNAHWRDGRLWCGHAMEIDSRAVARWYEIETANWPLSGSPTLIQSGEADLGTGNHTFFPAVYTDANGSAALVMAKSRSNEFASVLATGRQASDPLGTMGTPVQLDIGSAGANGRWGDYFDIALDPTDNQTFWMVGEIRTGNGWQTTINSFSIDAPFVPADDITVVRGLQTSGGLADIAESDDSRAEFQSEPVTDSSEALVWLVFDGTVTGDSPIELLIESQTGSVNLELTAEMWNWNQGVYESVGSQVASVNSDTIGLFDINPANHVNGNGDVRARLGWRAAGPVLGFPWFVRIDQMGWQQ